MDDWIVPLPSAVDINVFESILQGLDSSIEFILEKAMESKLAGGGNCKIINFLDVVVILHEDGKVETDFYYKATNSHDSLDFYSLLPKHINENIPFNLAKWIIAGGDRRFVKLVNSHTQIYILQWPYVNWLCT